MIPRQARYVDRRVLRIDAVVEADVDRRFDKLAAKLTWLANRHNLNLTEDRRHERITPEDPFTELKLPDGRTFRSRIIDLTQHRWRRYLRRYSLENLRIPSLC